MELQLALALIPTNTFDLNINNTSHETTLSSSFHANSTSCKKRRPLDFDPSAPFRPTLPLLLWNDHPNDGDDDSNDPNSSFSSNDPDDEEQQDNGLVGWPPLKKRRKRLFMQKRGGRGRPTVDNGGGFSRGLNLNLNSNSRYVKVKMEGVGIARKVDLSQYQSFDSLRVTLMSMFDESDSDGYRLIYQDIDGNWLLAEDVTWRNFMGTVQRMKLEKKYG